MLVAAAALPALSDEPIVIVLNAAVPFIPIAVVLLAVAEEIRFAAVLVTLVLALIAYVSVAFPQLEIAHVAAVTVMSSYAEQLDEVLVTVQRRV